VEIAAWDVAGVVIKTITYATTLSAGGGAAFLAWNGSRLSAALTRRIRRWLGVCVGTALLASLVWVIVLSGSMGGDLGSVFDGGLVRMVLEAGEGRATGLRVIGLVALTVALALPRQFVPLALGAANAATSSFAWVGHAWAASPSGGPVALLSVHLVAVAFWLGSLVPLWMATRDEELARLAAVVHAFAVAAVYAVAALVAAGALLLVVFLRAPSELWTTEYGRLVTLKLSVVVSLLGVASFNKLRLTPRLQTLDQTAVTALRRSIQLEAGLALVILAVTASFTTLVGPASLE
jgi:copper resistance protein D